MSGRASRELICDRYRLDKVLLDTSKTKIYSVVDSAGYKYAAKLTLVNDTQGGSFEDEVEVFQALTNRRISYGHRSHGITPEGFPDVYFVGRHRNRYDVIVIDKLSSDLFQLCRRKSLSMRTYQYLGCQMLDRLRELHRFGFVHRDVKPQNFMTDSRGKVHLIDFGLAKRYRNPRTKAHLPERRERYFCGTFIYASINAQRLVTQSRRDDLESLGYSLIEMIKKDLPWTRERDSRRIAIKKENTTLRRLCNGLPSGIYEYLMAVSALTYSEHPDYNELRQMLMST